MNVFRNYVLLILSFLQILYKNVEHPKLAAHIKAHDWLVESGEYLTFPEDQSVYKGGIQHYIESIEEVTSPFYFMWYV